MKGTITIIAIIRVAKLLPSIFTSWL